MNGAVVLALPFRDRWLVQNSPAARVPSHGTDLLGTRFAIDFVGVGDHRRTAVRTDWRTVLATEPPERFVGFGRPILAPADGVVVLAHDAAPDHAGRRSPLSLLPYTLGQADRLRAGLAAVAGNYLLIELAHGAGYVGLVHLRAGSLKVAVGDLVTTGERLAECGNSGNSTQPHVHVQVTDGPDLRTARGLPLAFRDFREWPRRTGVPEVHDIGIPRNGSVVAPNE